MDIKVRIAYISWGKSGALPIASKDIANISNLQVSALIIAEIQLQHYQIPSKEFHSFVSKFYITQIK